MLKRYVGDFDEVTDVRIDIDSKRWPTLSQYVNSVLTEQYHGLSTGLAEERRRGRSAADVGSNDGLLTVKNILTSLCKILAERIENRTIKNEKYPIPDIFQLMASCFELQDLLQRKVDSVENYRVLELKELLKQACSLQEITTNVLAQYQPRTQALLFYCKNIYTILQLYIEIKYTILQLYKEISIASAQGCLGRRVLPKHPCELAILISMYNCVIVYIVH